MKITIVGSGFGGVKTALELARDKRMDIHVITDKPDFQYYPSLYSSATGHSRLESWVALGEIFAKHDNIKVTIDPIIGIDAVKREVIGVSEARYHYDTLVLAVGSVTTYFGIPGIDQYSYGIKSADQISQLKERIHLDLSEDRKLDHNYIVIGGGPTGVELAGALGGYLNELVKYYDLPARKVNIRLIEAADRLLPHSHPVTSRRVRRRLEKLGVEVETSTMVEKQTAHQVIAGGRPIASHTVIWTSGVANNPLIAAQDKIFKFAKNHKVIVDKHLRAAPHIYVIGDNAATPFSGLAQTALYDAKFLAKNLKRHRCGRPPRDYHARQPASAVPIGANWATFEYRKLRLYGPLASVIRRAADFLGYADILPMSQALRPWFSAGIRENDYLHAHAKKKHSQHRKNVESDVIQ